LYQHDVKIGEVHHLFPLSKWGCQSRTGTPSHQHDCNVSARLPGIHPRQAIEKIHSFPRDSFVRQVFREATDYNDLDGESLSNSASISSRQIEKLWVRQKIEICPFIDIFV
jgi:hypothetical protein